MEDYSLSIITIREKLKIIEELANKRDYFQASEVTQNIFDDVSTLMLLLEDMEVIKNG